MILMVVRVDHDRRAQLVAEFQESFPSVSESGVDQQAIDKKSINLKKRQSGKPADHSNRFHWTIWLKVYRHSIHGRLLFDDHPVDDEIDELIRLVWSERAFRTVSTVGQAFE